MRTVSLFFLRMSNFKSYRKEDTPMKFIEWLHTDKAPVQIVLWAWVLFMTAALAVEAVRIWIGGI